MEQVANPHETPLETSQHHSRRVWTTVSRLFNRKDYEDDSEWDNISWNLNDTETSNLFARFESGNQALHNIARKVQPFKGPLPDLSKTAKIICWKLMPKPLHPSQPLPNLPSKDLVTPHKGLEMLYGTHVRSPVQLDDIQPGGRYRGKGFS